MSRGKARKGKGIIVTSRKRIKLDRRMANEIGVQRSAHVKKEQERAEEIARVIASSSAIHAQGAALREAAWRGDTEVPCSSTADWEAQDDGWMTPETGWKNAIFRLKNGSREILNCPHRHKTPDAARACAVKAVRARNASDRPMADGWSAAQLPWTDEAARTLASELRARG